jgi:hypothetical protein
VCWRQFRGLAGFTHPPLECSDRAYAGATLYAPGGEIGGVEEWGDLKGLGVAMLQGEIRRRVLDKGPASLGQTHRKHFFLFLHCPALTCIFMPWHALPAVIQRSAVGWFITGLQRAQPTCKLALAKHRCHPKACPAHVLYGS